MTTAKIIDYRIIQASYAPDFVEEVKWLLEQGWSLFGNLVIGSPSDNFVFAREMVLWEDDEC